MAGRLARKELVCVDGHLKIFVANDTYRAWLNAEINRTAKAADFRYELVLFYAETLHRFGRPMLRAHLARISPYFEDRLKKSPKEVLFQIPVEGTASSFDRVVDFVSNGFVYVPDWEFVDFLRSADSLKLYYLLGEDLIQEWRAESEDMSSWPVLCACEGGIHRRNGRVSADFHQQSSGSLAGIRNLDPPFSSTPTSADRAAPAGSGATPSSMRTNYTTGANAGSHRGHPELNPSHSSPRRTDAGAVTADENRSFHTGQQTPAGADGRQRGTEEESGAEAAPVVPTGAPFPLAGGGATVAVVETVVETSSPATRPPSTSGVSGRADVGGNSGVGLTVRPPPATQLKRRGDIRLKPVSTLITNEPTAKVRRTSDMLYEHEPRRSPGNNPYC